MKDNCPFSESGKCEIWIDYQILQYALEEAEELADANWCSLQSSAVAVPFLSGRFPMQNGRSFLTK